MNWEGHTGRDCGEHRTCGARAWCFDCSEWCNEAIPCVRCAAPMYRSALEIIVEGSRDPSAASVARLALMKAGDM